MQRQLAYKSWPSASDPDDQNSAFSKSEYCIQILYMTLHKDNCSRGKLSPPPQTIVPPPKKNVHQTISPIENCSANCPFATNPQKFPRMSTTNGLRRTRHIRKKHCTKSQYSIVDTNNRLKKGKFLILPEKPMEYFSEF